MAEDQDWARRGSSHGLGDAAREAGGGWGQAPRVEDDQLRGFGLGALHNFLPRLSRTHPGLDLRPAAAELGGHPAKATVQPAHPAFVRPFPHDIAVAAIDRVAQWFDHVKEQKARAQPAGERERGSQGVLASE